YKTTDGGKTWNHLDGHLPMATWDVEVDPSDANRVFATSFYDGRTKSISGINVSTDAGVNWTHPASSVPDNSDTATDNTPQPGYAASADVIAEPTGFGISFRPDMSSHAAVGTSAGLALTTDSGATWKYVDPFGTRVLFDTGKFVIKA